MSKRVVPANELELYHDFQTAISLKITVQLLST